MKIEPGKYFEIVYNLYRINPDGSETLVHEVQPEEPDNGILGVTPGYVVALENALLGLGEGDTFDFTADPENAFGPYDPEEVLSLPKERFIVDGKFDEEMFVPGALIPLMTSDGYRIDGQVVEVTPTEVKFDFNHPLAKDRVHYTGKVTLVRDSTEEELHPVHGCCGGGCGCHDGGGCGCEDGGCDDGGCGCGDGCGCK